MTTELIILAIALGLIATWFALVYTGVLPEKYKRATWGVVGILATLGILPLARKIGERRAAHPSAPPPPDIEPVTETEAETLDAQIEETIGDARETLDELADVDAREEKSRKLGAGDPDAGGAFADRVRRVRGDTE